MAEPVGRLHAVVVDLAQEFNRAFAVIGIVYGVLFAYWEHAELAQPGQQYADPVLPVLYCSWLIGWPLYYVGLIFVELAGRLRRA